MERECEGSGRDVSDGPPPNVAMTCPVCGRETKVDIHDADGGMQLTIARHQQVGTEPP
jgi:hypothetical protein